MHVKRLYDTSTAYCGDVAPQQEASPQRDADETFPVFAVAAAVGVAVWIAIGWACVRWVGAMADPAVFGSWGL